MPLAEMVVFGEWAGPGVQKNVALSLLKQKIFCVFALLMSGPDGEYYIVEPEKIEAILLEGDEKLPAGMFVLPWFADSRLAQPARLELPDSAATVAFLATANELTTEIDACDPFVDSVFGLRGAGEGLVWFPQTEPLTAQLMEAECFKTKGEAHMVQKLPAPAVLAPPVYDTVAQFVETFCTPQRMRQALASLDGPVTQRRFAYWLRDDIRKEGSPELGQLDWAAVETEILAFAAAQYSKRGIVFKQTSSVQPLPTALQQRQFVLDKSLNRPSKAALRAFVVACGGEIVQTGGILVCVAENAEEGSLTPEQLFASVFKD